MDRIFNTVKNELNIIDEDIDWQINSESSLQSWISWFCSLEGHELYLEVPEDFIEDEFNLTGLSAIIPFYIEALEMILDIEQEEISDDGQPEETNEVESSSKDDGFWKEAPNPTRQNGWVDPSVIEPYAAMLYGLIHQRYLVTRDGLRAMAERYSSEKFGVCPRVYCYKCPVIPCGRYDEMGREGVRFYCPSCLDIYCPPDPVFQSIDGSHFGTTYAHLLFETYSDLMPKIKSQIYEPRIFGFRVNESSISGPKMQWLRMKADEHSGYDDDSEDEQPQQRKILGGVKDEDETSLANKVEGWRMKESSFNSLLRRFF